MASRTTKAVFGGGCLVLLVLFAAGVILTTRAGKGEIPERTVLEVNLETEIPEMTPDDPFAAFSPGKATLRDVTDALAKGAADPRVTGLVARVGAAPMGMAQVQELRDAVKAFRASKKPAIAYSETFGEFAPGNASYYLASAFDEVWLQPSGDVCLNGLVVESVFLRGAFDKLGVRPRFDHRYEYKNAKNTYTETKFTPPHREAMDAIAASFHRQMVRGIAEGRKLDEAAVAALVDRGPFLGPEALEERLVDSLAYWDEAKAKVLGKAGKDARLLTLSKYLKRAGRPNAEGSSTIALIYGVGGVVRGKSGGNPVMGSQTMGSDTVAAAFRKAIEDDAVKAILFRVDSPGGSYVASDTIWRETVRAKKAGKPVVVSMGDVAGSGGYFVAMAADKIVAQPGTITGSIGVLGGKLVTPEMWAKLGITFDQVEKGANANMWNGSRDFSEAEWSRFQAWLDRVYADFTTKVAEGRKLPKEKVLEIAKGRIWSGEDAKGIGLVDEVGGMVTALSLARRAAKIPDAAKVKVVVYPKPKKPFEAVLAKLSGEEEETGGVDAAAEAVRTLRPALQALADAGLLGEAPGALSMTVPSVR